MRNIFLAIFTSILLIFVSACNQNHKTQKNNTTKIKEQVALKDSSITSEIEEIEKDTFELTDENALDFFRAYEKDLKENKVKLTTSLGSFTVELYNNVPYHRANFIYLTKKGYFNNTQFHRVVPNFIIQGGNSDDVETARKRGNIGRYLLPPDTKKGHKHHRGTISMPSSERDNPHKLASPFEFFIVVTNPGSYHLDSGYTPFGRVIEGMDVVDKINQSPIDTGEWPVKNIYILKAEAF
ncbi:hypothetical protein GCM10011414_28070 [Croceivirga lutea]|uniref:peptidylprolyl isomerase n=1 Tax=Croceivirga lutea TaxID=1775167 RepID=UPI00163AE86E|nr:peptidylprolyl isomerase [Croceivirga lutea]GGG56617.1 hypothetical protein GCM10011414_28070 [Croceivirga lutea]